MTEGPYAHRFRFSHRGIKIRRLIITTTRTGPSAPTIDRAWGNGATGSPLRYLRRCSCTRPEGRHLDDCRRGIPHEFAYAGAAITLRRRRGTALRRALVVGWTTHPASAIVVHHLDPGPGALLPTDRSSP